MTWTQEKINAFEQFQDDLRKDLEMADGWIGVDLDGTLAKYYGWSDDPFKIGEPVPRMVERVKQWLQEGKQVWIVTARVNFEVTYLKPEEQQHVHEAINIWCIKHIGQALPITYKKNQSMIELWDDRAVQVIPNTGERADGQR
jgi:phosphoserine phosphatase